MRFQLEFMLLLEPKLQKAGPKRSPSVVSFTSSDCEGLAARADRGGRHTLIDTAPERCFGAHCPVGNLVRTASHGTRDARRSCRSVMLPTLKWHIRATLHAGYMLLVNRVVSIVSACIRLASVDKFLSQNQTTITIQRKDAVQRSQNARTGGLRHGQARTITSSFLTRTRRITALQVQE
jgi:hypothetical protein